MCVFGLWFRLRPATPGWGVRLCVCSACTQPLLATDARCGCVCSVSGFGRASPLLPGVLGCVCAPLAPSHSWPRVRGVGVCVWARVSAAPRHSWLGCWAVCVLRLHAATPGHGCVVWVCVFGLGFRLRPATPGWGVGLCVCSACTQPLLATGARCGCVCLGSGFGCAPPLLAGMLGCVCAPLAPSHSWHGCAVWVCVFGLGFRLRPATPGWSVGLCVCSACTQLPLATGARCACVCLGSGFVCAPPLLAGVLGCVRAPLAPSHSWPRVRGVGVCVWARVSAAPRHSWLGCWAVCVLRLHQATPGHGCAMWVCVCLGPGFGCAPPLLAGVLGCECAPLAPSHSWPRVRGVGVCVWVWVSPAPRHFWLGCWAVCVLRLHPATPGHGCAVWVCLFGLGFRLRPATPCSGVGLCACSACTQPLLARVRRVGDCVWARVLAAPRHSWLGCWALCVLRLHPATPGHGCAVWVCVFGHRFRLRPATPGWGVGLCVCSACTQPLLPTGERCGCVCLGSDFGCAPPLLAGLLGRVRAPLAPSHSWHGCAVWVCVFGLGFRLRPATSGWGVGLCVCSACTQPFLATGARCACVCWGSGFGCAPPLLAGVLGCVRAPLAPSHSWPRVRGVGVCVWARISAAPRHSWLGCWAVCVLRLHPATPGRGARCGCVCLGSGFGCAMPLLAGVLACVRAPLAPSHSWPRVRGVGVCVGARVSATPRHSWLGCWAVCVLRLHPATPGCVCPWLLCCAFPVLFALCGAVLRCAGALALCCSCGAWLLLATGAVVRCRVLCCFLWCAVVRCWVWWPVVVCWCRAVAPCCPFCFVGLAGLCLVPVCAVLCCAARRVVWFRLRLRCCWCLVLWRVPVCCGVSLGVLRCGGAALVCRGVLLCCALSCGVLRPVPCPAVLCCLAVLCWWAVLCGCLRCWCYFFFFLLSSFPLLNTPAVFPCL